MFSRPLAPTRRTSSVPRGISGSPIEVREREQRSESNDDFSLLSLYLDDCPMNDGSPPAWK